MSDSADTQLIPVDVLIFQSGISKQRCGRRHNPYAFTEQGVAMLSSMSRRSPWAEAGVLRSERAVQVNVATTCPPKPWRRRMRAFVGLRRRLSANEALARKLGELEQRLEGHDQAIRSLFDAIRQLMVPPLKPRTQIGFHVKEPRAPYRVKRRRP